MNTCAGTVLINIQYNSLHCLRQK